MEFKEAELIEEIASEVMAALEKRCQIASIAARRPGFDLDLAYAVTARVLDLYSNGLALEL